MNLENYIEGRYRELQGNDLLDPEFLNLYESIENIKLKEILGSLHKSFNALFGAMNSRLPTHDFTNHFWAAQSRQLLLIIEITMGLHRSLKNSKYAFEIDEYYLKGVVRRLVEIHKSSGGLC